MKIRALRFAAILGMASIFWLAPGCAPSPSIETEQPVNVLLLVVDTLRADRLGCQGNDSGLTPAMDSAAADGVRFSNASAHSPWTLPSMASLLTSRHPSRHRAGEKLGPFRFSTLPPEVPTLQEQFAGAGYQTAAVINVDFLSRCLRDDPGVRPGGFCIQRIEQRDPHRGPHHGRRPPTAGTDERNPLLPPGPLLRPPPGIRPAGRISPAARQAEGPGRSGPPLRLEIGDGRPAPGPGQALPGDARTPRSAL